MKKSKDRIRIVFGIGSNLGNRKKNIVSAISILEKKLDLKNLLFSEIYENPAMLPKDAPLNWKKDFLNIAISGDIDCSIFSPLEILKIIKNTEKEIGRIDRERWAPREIDIDILLYGDKKILIQNVLEIPHNGLFKRDFFLKTVTEIEPKMLKAIFRI